MTINRLKDSSSNKIYIFETQIARSEAISCGGNGIFLRIFEINISIVEARVYPRDRFLFDRDSLLLILKFVLQIIYIVFCRI